MLKYERKIFQKCSWCGKSIGIKIVFTKIKVPDITSHGICKECVVKYFKDLVDIEKYNEE